ncbi:MAG: neutral/alkaline non-lysosomal ceramidase N-terminal domain-containing protein [Candidatus Omnitrophica bacterium]|nr:neutral/alkaline non-lysosomal ceramidase N-terminal domain-containing protein [Candidatus Omnitrophota bacterium]MCM8827944.1 neutral/alkaline non-lysosomal ceramidase N-terminal domain-containing protein [Candidatus Omnitrophota bacterium]
MKKIIAGFGQVDITPPLNIPYLGFYPKRHNFFKGIHDPLYVRTLYISDGDTKAIIVCADAIGFSNSLCPEKNFISKMRKKISMATGVKEKNIMVTANHIHSAPETLDFRPLRKHPGAKQYLQNLLEKISSSAEIAVKDAFPACLMASKGRVEKISRNRTRDDCLDNELILLVFQSEDERKIFIVNFPCHPVIVQAQDMVSADFVGVLCKKIPEIIDRTTGCIFLQAACGDINPVKNATGSFSDVYFTAMALAGEVIKTFYQMQLTGYVLQPVDVKVISKKVLFPSRRLPDKEEIKVLEKKARHGDGYAEEVLWRVKEGNKPFEGEIQIIKAGNVILVGIPGEPFCKLGKEIKKMSEPFLGIPVGYANGYLGYIATDQAWKTQIYEVECGPWSKIGPEGYSLIIENFKKLKTRI